MSTSLNSNSTTPLSTLDQDGEAVYEKQLKAALEPQHSGEFVAIEPSSGRYFLGETATAALVAARNAMPDSLFFPHARRQDLRAQNRRPWLTNQVASIPQEKR